MLTRDQILGAEDRETREVEIPEWGGSVTIRSLSGADRARLETFAAKAGDGTQGLRELYVTLSVVDGDGKHLFTDADTKALGEKSVTALDRVVEAVIEINALSDEEVSGLEGN